MIRVSVVVPFRDAEAFLEPCLEALENQSMASDRYEILAVDNGSRDGSNAIVGRHGRVRHLHENAPGPYAARNRGIAEARGSVLAFTDADCRVAPDWLARIDEAMDDTAVGIAQGRSLLATDRGILAQLAAYENEKAAFVFRQPIRERYYAYTNNMAVRLALFEELGCFAEWERGADVAFAHRVLGVHGPEVIRYVSEMVVHHLEIARLRDYYRKQLVYGSSTRAVSRVVPYRPLTWRERSSLWRTVAQGRRPRPWPRIRLGLALTLGAVIFEAAWHAKAVAGRQELLEQHRPLPLPRLAS